MLTIPIVILTCIISYLCLSNPDLLGRLSHRPYTETKLGEYHRLVSSDFVHGSGMHLAINMYVLYTFGEVVERAFFSPRFGALSNLAFAFFYLSAIVVANLGTFFKHQENPRFSSVGASGVTSALVFMYAMMAPWQMFAFPPVPAIVFAVLYAGYSTWASKNRQDGIDHLAHLYGGLYGVAFMFITTPSSIKTLVEGLNPF